MESLKNLIGLEPYQLVYEESLILLRTSTPWPLSTGPQLPEGVAMFQKNGSFLRVDPDALVTHAEALSKLKLESVVLVNCPQLDSDSTYLAAATAVLGQAPTAVVVHNVTELQGLLRVFHSALVLYLLHDLRVHTGKSIMMQNTHSKLRVLYGDCSTMLVNHLLMNVETICSLVACCPNVSPSQC